MFEDKLVYPSTPGPLFFVPLLFDAGLLLLPVYLMSPLESPAYHMPDITACSGLQVCRVHKLMFISSLLIQFSLAFFSLYAFLIVAPHTHTSRRHPRPPPPTDHQPPPIQPPELLDSFLCLASLLYSIPFHFFRSYIHSFTQPLARSPPLSFLFLCH